jgi:hypothetical protein
MTAGTRTALTQAILGMIAGGLLTFLGLIMKDLPVIEERVATQAGVIADHETRIRALERR